MLSLDNLFLPEANFVLDIWSIFTHLFDGEVINEMVVVLIEAAMQGHTVRVDQQVLQSGHSLQAK